jgi:hypothetical protein
LIIVDDGLKRSQSKAGRDFWDATGDPETGGGVFTVRLVCSKPSCKEAVYCTGKFAVEQMEESFRAPFWGHMLTPLFFYPTIHIFKLPNSLPDKIREPLLEAFSLYWSNPSASGNSLRNTLEALMDQQRVKKSFRDKSGKRHLRTLHFRIVAFGERKPDLGKKLEAVKWLGNSGSHQGGLTAKNIITGFKIMENVIEELFQRRKSNLDSVVRQIIRRKGPI